MAKNTINFAPMLAVLFIGCRMRALQIDPVNGHPQSWAQTMFFICTFSVLAQTILVILLPCVTECTCKQGAAEGDIIFEMKNPTLGMIMDVARYAMLICLYGGFTAIGISAATIS